MSQVKISGNASGTGILTVAAPNTNTDYTLTLPAETGSVLTSVSDIPVANITGTIAGTGPALKAHNGSTQSSISGSTWTKLNINTVDFDTASDFDTGNYRFTPSVAGYYWVRGHFSAYANSGSISRVIIAIYKNGNQEVIGPDLTISGGQEAIEVSGLVSCNGSTDYIEIWGWVAHNGTVQFTSGYSYIDSYLARAA